MPDDCYIPATGRFSCFQLATRRNNFCPYLPFILFARQRFPTAIVADETPVAELEARQDPSHTPRSVNYTGNSENKCLGRVAKHFARNAARPQSPCACRNFPRNLLTPLLPMFSRPFIPFPFAGERFFSEGQRSPWDNVNGSLPRCFPPSYLSFILFSWEISNAEQLIYAADIS